MFNLRPYQQDFIDDIRSAWLKVRSVLGVMPTGGGKTVVFSSIMHDHVGSSAAVVHRREIVAQISLSLARLGVKHRLTAPPKTVEVIRRKHLKVLGKSFIDPHAKAGVVSVQTLTSKASGKNLELKRWLKQITLCVYDEGHHYVKQGIWAKAVTLMGEAKLLFVTATPERADGKGLGSHADGFADIMVEGPTTQWLIDNKFLSKFTYKAPATDLNVDNIPITATGDLNTRAMRKRIIESHLVGDVVQHYLEFAAGEKTIVFANDVETAHEHAAAFRTAGIKAVALSGKTDQTERDAELDDFENGDLQVLVNVDLFDEGFDVPKVVCVIMARKTESLAKFLQMIGRSLRILAGKLTAIVIDAVGNWERHGMPNWPRRWTLSGRDKQTRAANDDVCPQKVCPACTQPYEAFYVACPYCGHVALPMGRAAPEQVDGDLYELDVDGMAALFAAQQKAEMSDEEFALDQTTRNVPHIGRSRELKRYQAAKYRRKVLRELVGWWVGAQTNRDMSEVHRRFFHRFGIDIGTAFTLSADDTDALIETIKRKFSEDLAA